MVKIDRARVQKAFHRQAGLYEDTVVVQKRVIGEFVRQLELEAADVVPQRVLDVGAGTGMLLRAVQRLYPGSLLVGLDLAQGMGSAMLEASGREINFVAGDAERIPFAEAAFDLVVSTSTFQWLDDLDGAFREVERVLARGGLFRFALFGGRTLWELRSSYVSALRESGRQHEDRTHSFFTQQEVEEELKSAGFNECATFCSVEMEYHEDIPHLLRSLRRAGAGNACRGIQRGLSARSTMEKMMSIYRREFFGRKGVPATYEVIYGYGRKKM